MHKTIEALMPINTKCVRCSLCKFPPLAVVKDARFSMICPSYKEYKFHSHSGGGRNIIAIAFKHSRAPLTLAVRDAVYQCMLCGGCDMTCKYASDIELLDMMYALRAEIFRRIGPPEPLNNILEKMDQDGHVLGIKGDKGDWLREAGISPGTAGRDMLLFAGDRYALVPERRRMLIRLAKMFEKGGVNFGVLGAEEPTTGRMALDIGDRQRFDRHASGVAEAIRRTGIKTVVCADPEDLNTLLAHVPKVANLNGIKIISALELLADLVKKKKIKPVKALNKKVAFHDPCTLGRLSESYKPWNGKLKKIMGQLEVYDPPRPVNRGKNGCYDPPRRILSAIPGLKLTPFYREREYTYCCGGNGLLMAAGYEAFVRHTAFDRMDEARSAGAEVVVTACPGCLTNLSGAVNGRTIEVRDIIDVLADSVNIP
jgi:Fe-S oxidoreductase